MNVDLELLRTFWTFKLISSNFTTLRRTDHADGAKNSTAVGPQTLQSLSPSLVSPCTSNFHSSDSADYVPRPNKYVYLVTWNSDLWPSSGKFTYILRWTGYVDLTVGIPRCQKVGRRAPVKNVPAMWVAERTWHIATVAQELNGWAIRGALCNWHRCRSHGADSQQPSSISCASPSYRLQQLARYPASSRRCSLHNCRLQLLTSGGRAAPIVNTLSFDKQHTILLSVTCPPNVNRCSIFFTVRLAIKFVIKSS